MKSINYIDHTQVLRKRIQTLHEISTTIAENRFLASFYEVFLINADKYLYYKKYLIVLH